MSPEAKMPTGAFFIQKPVVSLYLEKIIYYAQLVHHLLSSNFLATSHDAIPIER
jgi:hypothetical protein